MNNKQKLFQEDSRVELEDIEYDQFISSQSHLLYSQVQTNQEFKVFDLQHQQTLGFIKLDGQINLDMLQIKHKNISKKKQINSNPTQCPYCKQDFSSPQAVGGHLSKAHSGESTNYQIKIAKREERKYEFRRTRQIQIIIKNDLDYL